MLFRSKVSSIFFGHQQVLCLAHGELWFLSFRCSQLVSECRVFYYFATFLDFYNNPIAYGRCMPAGRMFVRSCVRACVQPSQNVLILYHKQTARPRSTNFCSSKSSMSLTFIVKVKYSKRVHWEDER